MRKIPASAKRRDPRCASGVEGLDDILAGGLPRDCFYLVQGDPGSGKTTLALQFLLEGLRRGEKVFYITLSETREELLRVARSHGWSIDNFAVGFIGCGKFTPAGSADDGVSSIGSRVNESEPALAE
jgi:KaiC/GvpD/RAD55 family RecA-like ATPase